MALTFRGITYQQIAPEDCLSLALSFEEAGKRWHSHVLSPGCVHNPFADVYATVIEDDDMAIAYIANCGASFPEVDKDLVKMLHGADILDGDKAHGEGAPHASPLFSHLIALQQEASPWHHHMHFPICAFNPHPGKWSISVESPVELFTEKYDTEPVDLLREIEVLYFANLNHTPAID